MLYVVAKIRNVCSGILNVHASLLPRWRGAAPIIHAIANEDLLTGISIMRIHPEKFDIGDIVEQKSLTIERTVILPELYNMLAKLGAETITRCLHQLPYCLNNSVPQSNIGISYGNV